MHNLLSLKNNTLASITFADLSVTDSETDWSNRSRDYPNGYRNRWHPALRHASREARLPRGFGPYGVTCAWPLTSDPSPWSDCTAGVRNGCAPGWLAYCPLSQSMRSYSSPVFCRRFWQQAPCRSDCRRNSLAPHSIRQLSIPRSRHTHQSTSAATPIQVKLVQLSV